MLQRLPGRHRYSCILYRDGCRPEPLSRTRHRAATPEQNPRRRRSIPPRPRDRISPHLRSIAAGHFSWGWTPSFSILLHCRTILEIICIPEPESQRKELPTVVIVCCRHADERCSRPSCRASLSRNTGMRHLWSCSCPLCLSSPPVSRQHHTIDALPTGEIRIDQLPEHIARDVDQVLPLEIPLQQDRQPCAVPHHADRRDAQPRTPNHQHRDGTTTKNGPVRRHLRDTIAPQCRAREIRSHVHSALGRTRVT